MPVTTAKKVWTDEELLRVKHEGKVELVNGRLIKMTPAGLEQGRVNARFTVRLGSYILRRKLGEIFDAQTGFRPRRNMRAPDFSFVRKERLPDGRVPEGIGHFPPDLAVEVLGPKETISDYESKIAEYLDWGVPLIWILDPKTKTVTVVRQKGERVTLKGNDVLSGEEVVPGFKVRVRKIFE